MRLSTASFIALASVALVAAAPVSPRWAAVTEAASRLKLSGRIDLAVDGTVNGADFDAGAPTAKAGDLWRWASVTKQVIAVLAMQEVERGRLSLDVPIARYVPTLKIANADRITVRQLLQHNSGLATVDSLPTGADEWPLVYLRASPRSKTAINEFCFGPARAEPGTGFYYNNCDTEVAGAVIAAVAGQSLPELLEQRIFKPAGMTGTRLLKPGDDAGRPGFYADGHDDSAIDVGRYGAAGGLAGPPSDLIAFDQALLDGRLLKPESRVEMWRGDPKLSFSGLSQWAYEVPLKGCGKPVMFVERRGDIGGVQIRNIMVPETGTIMTVFTDRPIDFGEPWSAKGAAYDLLSAALCPAA